VSVQHPNATETGAQHTHNTQTQLTYQAMPRYYVYLLRSLHPDHQGRTYTGITCNLARRLKEHNTLPQTPRARRRYTARYQPWQVASYCGSFTGKQARQIEYKAKHTRTGDGLAIHHARCAVAILGPKRKFTVVTTHAEVDGHTRRLPNTATLDLGEG
jgi:predicted GIY-YIG superfamily endonuclease